MSIDILRMFKMRWLTPPKPVTESYEGRNVIVTGATSGIGAAAVAKFAALGAQKVVIAARTPEKGEATRAAIAKKLGRSDQLEVWELEMSSYDSVVAFAKRAQALDHLDIAILNAGVWRAKYRQAGHGWEEVLQVNTLSTALLAILLLPKLIETRAKSQHTPVLEFVNSGLHEKAIVSAKARNERSILEWCNRPENYGEASQYSFSKVFQIYAMIQLANQVSSKDVIITSICPGFVESGIARDHFFPGVKLVLFVLKLLALSPDVGTNTVLSGTTQGEQLHGRFWKEDHIVPIPLSVAGEENKNLALRIWEEIVDTLVKDVPAVREALNSISPGQQGGTRDAKLG